MSRVALHALRLPPSQKLKIDREDLNTQLLKLARYQRLSIRAVTRQPAQYDRGRSL